MTFNFCSKFAFLYKWYWNLKNHHIEWTIVLGKGWMSGEEWSWKRRGRCCKRSTGSTRPTGVRSWKCLTFETWSGSVNISSQTVTYLSHWQKITITCTLYEITWLNCILTLQLLQSGIPVLEVPPMGGGVGSTSQLERLVNQTSEESLSPEIRRSAAEIVSR